MRDYRPFVTEDKNLSDAHGSFCWCNDLGLSVVTFVVQDPFLQGVAKYRVWASMPFRSLT